MTLPRFIYANEKWLVNSDQLFEKIQCLKNKDPLYLLSSKCIKDSDFNVNLWLPDISSEIQFCIDVKEDECNCWVLYNYISEINIYTVTDSNEFKDMLKISNRYNPGYPISIRPWSNQQYIQKLETVFDIFKEIELI